MSNRDEIAPAWGKRPLAAGAVDGRSAAVMYDRIIVPKIVEKQSPTVLKIAGCLAERWDIPVRVVEPNVESFLADYYERAGALVLIGTQARGHALGVFDDLAGKLLLRIAEPLLLVGPHADVASDWPRGPMLICSDGTPFSESIYRSAGRWAKALDVEPRLISVTRGAPIQDCDNPAMPGHPLRELGGLIESVVGRQVHYDLLHATDTAAAITDHAQWQGASLIAMTTHSRSGLARLRFGSVATKVLSRASCPVLVRNPQLEPLDADPDQITS